MQDSSHYSHLLFSVIKYPSIQEMHLLAKHPVHVSLRHSEFEK